MSISTSGTTPVVTSGFTKAPHDALVAAAKAVMFACAACAHDGSHPIDIICPCCHLTWSGHNGHHCVGCGKRNCFPPVGSIGTKCGVTDCSSPTCGTVYVPHLRARGGKGKLCLTCEACVDQLWEPWGGIPPVHLATKIHHINGIATSWSILDPNLCLARGAADFYVLLATTLQGKVPAKAPKMFEQHTAYMAEQLACYLEMACLGELRHTFSDSDCQAFVDNGTAASTGGKGSKRSEAVQPLLTYMLTLLARVRGPEHGHWPERFRWQDSTDFRMATWRVWSQVFETFGLPVYEIIATNFRDMSWPRLVGGEKWAVCTDTVGAFRRGETSPLVFVDQALSLEHNGNVAYDKFWVVQGLDYILSWAQHGAVGYMEHYASQPVKQLRQSWRKRNGKAQAQIRTA